MWIGGDSSFEGAEIPSISLQGNTVFSWDALAFSHRRMSLKDRGRAPGSFLLGFAGEG